MSKAKINKEWKQINVFSFNLAGRNITQIVFLVSESHSTLCLPVIDFIKRICIISEGRESPLWRSEHMERPVSILLINRPQI